MAIQNEKWDGLARPNEPQRRPASASHFRSRQEKIQRWRGIALVSGRVVSIFILIALAFAAILLWNGFDLSGGISFSAFSDE